MSHYELFARVCWIVILLLKAASELLPASGIDDSYMIALAIISVAAAILARKEK